MKRLMFYAMRWLLLLAFFVIACVLVVVIIGESANEDYSIMLLFGTKIMAICTLYVGCKVGKWCFEHKLLPKAFTDYVQICKTL